MMETEPEELDHDHDSRAMLLTLLAELLELTSIIKRSVS